MADQTNQYKPVTREELEQIAGEPLPERAAMSLVNANVAIPVNLALAANVLSDDAIAYADATQDAAFDQSTQRVALGGLAALAGEVWDDLTVEIVEACGS